MTDSKLVTGALSIVMLASFTSVLAAPMPTPGCTVDAKEMAINKAAVMKFFSPGITLDERIALMDPGYIQHNPEFVKRQQTDKISSIEAVRRIFSSGRFAGPPGDASAPRPPQGDPNYIVMGECDIVTIIRKTYRQDPAAPPGTWYEYFPYDTYRMKNGKMMEHWDGFDIGPARPPGG